MRLNVFIAFFAAGLFAGLFPCAPFSRSGEAELAHAIFVKVNGQTITQEQVLEAAKYLIKREYNDVTPADEEELDKIQQAALRDLVRTYLILDTAKRAGIVPSPEAFKRAERSSGLKQEEVTPTIRRMLVVDDIFEELMMAQGTPINQPSPREVKEFYAKNRDEFKTNTFIIIRTIFLPLDPRRSQAFMKNQGDTLLRQISVIPMPQRTDAFAAAAVEYSQDVFSQFGGLLTGDAPEKWIPKDFNNNTPDGGTMFPPTMVEEIRRLNKPGDIRLAVSEDGIHLVYCEDVRGGQEIAWGEAKRIIEYVITERVRNKRLRQWLHRVYDRSDVRWHDGTVFDKNALTEILLPSERVPQDEDD